MSFRKELVSVNVAGEEICQEVFVDDETGMDVDTHSGAFRTREETTTMIKEVYEVGKVSMKGELERYNKWVQKAQGTRIGGSSASVSHQDDSNMFKKMGGSSATYTTPRQPLVTPEKLQKEGISEKNKGNEYFTKSKMHHALICYRRSAQILEAAAGMMSSNKSKRDVVEVTRQCSIVWSNMAECNIRLDRLGCAEKCAREALKLDPTSDKALHRLTVALEASQQHKDASTTQQQQQQQETITA